MHGRAEGSPVHQEAGQIERSLRVQGAIPETCVHPRANWSNVVIKLAWEGVPGVLR